jgi:chlorophyll synthase/bacteriochlorophyll c synthase
MLKVTQDKIVVSTSQQSVSLSRRILAHIKLADPVTWFSPLLMCVCGAFASSYDRLVLGGSDGFNPSNSQHLWLLVLGMIMTGPLGTGFSQSINDYFDRELDAINDPTRPIPAGEVTLREARLNWIFLGAATLLLSLVFQTWQVTFLACMGLVLAVLYSVPPFKLKKHVWLGAPSVGMGYVFVTWLAVHLIFAPLTWQSVTVALINGIMVAGILFLNDIKSVEGDRLHGLKSLTVVLGVHRAVLVAYAVINGSQVALLFLALLWGHLWVAGFIMMTLIIPIYSQVQLYREPSHKNFMRYNLIGNPFVSAIQVVSGLVVGGYFG